MCACVHMRAFPLVLQTRFAARVVAITHSDRDSQPCAVRVEDDHSDRRLWLPPHECEAISELDGNKADPFSIGAIVPVELRCQSSLSFLSDPARTDRCTHEAQCIMAEMLNALRSRECCPVDDCPVQLPGQSLAIIRDDALRNSLRAQLRRRLHSRRAPTAGLLGFGTAPPDPGPGTALAAASPSTPRGTRLARKLPRPSTPESGAAAEVAAQALAANRQWQQSAVAADSPPGVMGRGGEEYVKQILTLAPCPLPLASPSC